MTSLISHRPMSDPFAPNPTGRFSIAPFTTPRPPFTNPITGLFAQAVASQQGMPAQRAMSMAPQAAHRDTDEFGSYETDAESYNNAAAARSRASQPPSMVMAMPNASASSNPSTQRTRNRQSHNPAATLNASPPRPEHLTDYYVLHPSVWAYKEAHPRRPMVAFGPYVLLQTLGEGEFGKVKLGVHSERGVEVAIKLIRRGSLEDEARATKVEREIDVLKGLKHPNIVRMLDVIDTEKYIGIVLEYAGGGELFDHILANKYLKERDAARLFAQLISGVDYLHRKHIVHRDLKLENLLLDKHRNIIITDFGFANGFDREQDDLMATSCGSPCYAAPELVISEGLYVGSAVDIWSCGVILYAMLSGYLPFDDDPDNPDSDNINLLYNYIISTHVNFPDHLSESARHLLGIMLVPDPDERCSIDHIKAHPWLSAYRQTLYRSVEQQEYIFQENMQRKRQLAARELADRLRVQQQAHTVKINLGRSQSSMPGSSVTSMSNQTRRREARHQSAMPGTTTMPEFLNNAGRPHRQSLTVPPPIPAAAQTSPVLADAIVMSPKGQLPSPSSRPYIMPASASGSYLYPVPSNSSAGSASASTPQAATIPDKDASPPRPPLSTHKNRHTIQVEYDGEASYEKVKEIYESQRLANPLLGVPSPTRHALHLETATSDIEAESASSDQGHTVEDTVESFQLASETPTPEATQVLTPPAFSPPATADMDATNDMVSMPSTPSKSQRAVQPLSPATPRASQQKSEDIPTPRARPRDASSQADTPRSSGKRFESMPGHAESARPGDFTKAPVAPMGLPNIPSKRDRVRKGMSLDKFGLAKLLGSSHASSSVDLARSPPSAGAAAINMQSAQQSSRKNRFSLRPGTADAESKDRKPQRRTLQTMVTRSNSVRSGKLPDNPSAKPLAAQNFLSGTSATAGSSGSAKSQPTPPMVDTSQQDPQHVRIQSSVSVASADHLATQAHVDKQQASSSAAKKVMDWFRRKSTVKENLATMKQGGIRSDSASSFVQVSDSPIRSARDRAAVTKAGTIGENDDATLVLPVPDPATLPQDQAAIQAPAQQKVEYQNTRTPLGPANNKTNIVPQTIGTSESLSVQLPGRSKSISPDATVPIDQPLSASTALTVKAPARPTPSRPSDEIRMRVHTGLVDQSALSSKPPKAVMLEVTRVLQEMGIEVKKENEFRLRCTRAKKRKSGVTLGLGLGNVNVGGAGSFTSMGSLITPGTASISKGDSRGQPLPSTSSGGLLSGSSLKGMLLRRGSSHSSTHPVNLARSDSDILNSPTASSAGFGTPAMLSTTHLPEPLYGEHSVDNGDEVRFVVELCRMKNLPGLYLLNIKRLRGGVWSFKFIYQTVLERCETLTH